LGDLIGEGYDADVYGRTGEDPVQGQVSSTIGAEFFYDPGGSATPDPSRATYPGEVIVGEPRKLFAEVQDDEVGELKRREGADYSTGYNLVAIAAHNEIPVYLTALMKFIIYRKKMEFEVNGMRNIKLSATDYVPVPAYIADTLWSRSIGLQFDNDFSYFYVVNKEKEGIASAFDITMLSTVAPVFSARIGCVGEQSTETSVLPNNPELLSVSPVEIRVGIPAVLLLVGNYIQYGATARFDPSDGAGVPSISVIDAVYKSGNRLEIEVLAASAGIADVTVVNPDFQEATLEEILTVLP